MRPAFEIKQSPTGSYYFTFKNAEGTTHIISCSFPDRAQLEACLANVRGTVPFAPICTDSCGASPYFIIQQKEQGIFFSLIGFNMESIFCSIFSSDAKRCKEAIHALKVSVQKAIIVDLTYE